LLSANKRFVLARKMFHPVHEMSKVFNSNGNGNGANGLLEQPPQKAAKPPTVAPSSAVKESQVTFQTVEGVELRGTPVRVTRHATVFELYNPSVTPRLSEALGEFQIILQGRAIYSGRAVVRSMVDAGTKIVCEATLNESSWADLNLGLALEREGGLAKEFKVFLQEWQKVYKVLPEFKIAVADLQAFLYDLRLWLEQVELGVRLQPADRRAEYEHRVLQTLQEPILSALVPAFEKFEALTSKIEKEAQPVHSLYAKHRLHPLVLCAPFMHRTFQKPLGYAGDYEMVNMMTRSPFQGGSIFAKILNTFFLNTPPVVAHRNRIDHLTQTLDFETQRATRRGRRARVFNLGCGPAMEVQRFLTHSPLNQNIEFTLLDFNDETVGYTQRTLDQIKQKNSSASTLRVIKKSVVQLLKDNSRFGRGSYDLVYCAGLFDYLTADVCAKLVDLFYELAAPGGLVLVSNVDASNPSRGWMEYMVDWNLIHRDAQQMAALLPGRVSKDAIRIVAEPTSVNIFAEIRKPENV
jgi:extracellular factor (EF) 3-hydroxypalmitic acid methyl ester biosynthesis protein